MTEESPVSWAYEVIADSTRKWLPNGLRFATEVEALRAAQDLRSRWMEVEDIRTVPSADPVINTWRDGRLVFLKDEKADAAD